MYGKYIKRTADFCLAFVSFIIASPLFIITIILLGLANRGSVFFFQIRPGKNEIPFRIIKFKTMNDRKDENGNLLSDDIRLTAVGKWVRRLSLDEIPQLFNVMKGDMSLIGPRPLLMQYIPLYNKFQRRRHEVRPGITGWAQVNGRNSISWDQKFELDVWYIDNLSFRLDIIIIVKTLINIIRREGVNQEGQSTVEYFKGNLKNEK